MDEEWLNWSPNTTVQFERVTPQSFNWTHPNNAAPQTPTPSRARSFAEYEQAFLSAPASVRKAWLDYDDDPLHPSLKKESPFSFGRVDSSDKPSNVTNLYPEEIISSPAKDLGAAAVSSSSSSKEDLASAEAKRKSAGQFQSPAQVASTAPDADGANETKTGVPTTPTRSIRPNGIAPIGSEVKELNQRRESEKHQTLGSLGGLPVSMISPCQGIVNVTEHGDEAPATTSSNVKDVAWPRKLSFLRDSEPDLKTSSNKTTTSTNYLIKENARQKEESPAQKRFNPRPEMAIADPHDRLDCGSGSGSHRKVSGGSDGGVKLASMKSNATKSKSLAITVLDIRDFGKNISLTDNPSRSSSLNAMPGTQRCTGDLSPSHSGENTIQLSSEVNSLQVQKATAAGLKPAPSKHKVAFQKPVASRYAPHPQRAPGPSVMSPSHQLPSPARHAVPVVHHPAQCTHHGSNEDTHELYGQTHDAQAAVEPGSPEFVRTMHTTIPATLGVSHSRPDRQMPVAANPGDDVFEDGVGTNLAPGLRYYLSTQNINQKPLNEATNDCFSGVERVVNSMPMVQIKSNRASPPLRDLISLCQEHIMNRREVYPMFEIESEKYFLMTGVVSQQIVDKIFRTGCITEFRCQYQTQFRRIYDEEMAAKDVMPICCDLVYRFDLAKQRAELATRITQEDGFWVWVRDYTYHMVDDIVGTIQAGFDPACIPALKEQLWRPVNDAIRLAIRIRQAPLWFDYYFQRVGTTWEGTFMIHRNPELVGQELTSVRSPYVVRCTARPLIKWKDFSTGTSAQTVVIKAEVLVCERRNNLRPWNETLPGRYRRHRRH